MKRDLFIRRAATAATIFCVAVVAGSVLLLAVPEWRRALGIGPPDGPVYAVGDRVDVPAALYSGSPFTLLVMSRADCAACQTAKPALAGLVSAIGSKEGVRVTMVVREGTETGERDYLQEIGLPRDHLAAVKFEELRVQHVPTIVLVDRQGQVRYSLEGTPSVLDQGEILRIITSPHAVR